MAATAKANPRCLETTAIGTREVSGPAEAVDAKSSGQSLHRQSIPTLQLMKLAGITRQLRHEK